MKLIWHFLLHEKSLEALEKRHPWEIMILLQKRNKEYIETKNKKCSKNKKKNACTELMNDVRRMHMHKIWSVTLTEYKKYNCRFWNNKYGKIVGIWKYLSNLNCKYDVCLYLYIFTVIFYDAFSEPSKIAKIFNVRMELWSIEMTEVIALNVTAMNHVMVTNVR